MPDPRIVACVTAFNEEGTVGQVVQALRASPVVARVQVIDDASTDATAQLAQAAGATVHSLPERVPVGKAIRQHLEHLAEGEWQLWCDADLIGLRPEHPVRLESALRAEGAEMAVGVKCLPEPYQHWFPKGGSHHFFRRLFGSISGERLLPVARFREAMAQAEAWGLEEVIDGYGIVLFLNWYLRKQGFRETRLYFPEITQRQKTEKWGRSKAGEMVGEWWQFFRTWWQLRLFCESRYRRDGLMATAGQA
ncbi:MAG: glycosyltransferase [Verrucomicrobiota bacterium]